MRCLPDNPESAVGAFPAHFPVPCWSTRRYRPRRPGARPSAQPQRSAAVRAVHQLQSAQRQDQGGGSHREFQPPRRVGRLPRRPARLGKAQPAAGQALAAGAEAAGGECVVASLNVLPRAPCMFSKCRSDAEPNHISQPPIEAADGGECTSRRRTSRHDGQARTAARPRPG